MSFLKQNVNKQLTLIPTQVQAGLYGPHATQKCPKMLCLIELTLKKDHRREESIRPKSKIIQRR